MKKKSQTASCPKVAYEEQKHEEEETFSVVAGMLSASVRERGWITLLWAPSRRENCWIRNIGEGEALNNYQYTMSVALSKGGVYLLDNSSEIPFQSQNTLNISNFQI